MLPAALHRIAPVVNVFSTVVMIFALTMAAPLVVSLIYDDGALLVYDEAIAITFFAGLILRLTTVHQWRELQPRDGFLLVFMVWTILPAFATLPLMLYIDGLSFTDAYFETMSGMTTTGATVLSDLDKLPPSINFWRGLLQWLGGMGIIVLAVAILPLLGVGGRQMFKAETPGPMKDTKLTPRITETAKVLWVVYAVITLALILSLKLAGMSWIDAIVHAFAAMSLGGFSSHDASVGYFDSPLIEAILIFFMLIAAINFATHFLAWRQKSLKAYLRDAEVQPLLVVVLGSCVGVALYLWRAGTYDSFFTALRYVSFNLVSVATDCGFANTDFNQWPIFAPIWMLFLSCICANAGSTGGGIKMMRTLLLFKQGMREMIRLIHPQAQVPVKLGGQVIPNQIVFAVLAFMSIYGATVISTTLLLTATGLDFISALSAIIACINNMGPGLNQVGPATTYAVLTDFQTWVCTFTMLAGRLELFTAFILFTPAFWRR